MEVLDSMHDKKASHEPGWVRVRGGGDLLGGPEFEHGAGLKLKKDSKK